MNRADLHAAALAALDAADAAERAATPVMPEVHPPDALNQGWSLRIPAPG